MKHVYKVTQPIISEINKLVLGANWMDRKDIIDSFRQSLDSIEDIADSLAEREIKEDKEFATVNLTDIVYITDPCYEAGTWCQGVVTNVMPGEYRCIRRLAKDEIFNTAFRVAQIRVIKIGYEAASLKYKRLPITVGVDSGQAGIFNEKYYEDNQPKEEWYDRICELTNDEHFGVIDNEGVVSRTGYGDGSYRAYAAFYDGKIVGIKIYYI